MAVVVFLVFLLPLSLFLFILLKHGNSNCLPPSPPSLSLIGHLHMQLFDNSAPHIFLSKLSHKYGSLVYLRFGFKPILVVSSAKMANEVMKTHDLDFCSRPHQRSFGKRYDEEGAERSRFHELLNESEAILSSFSFSDYFPYMGWLDRFTGLLSRLEKSFKELDTFYQQLIDEHLDPNRLKPQQEDILDVLLQTWKDRDFSFDLNIDQIKAILMNVFFGGTDTSSATVIWVMSFLMKNPKCLKKTQAEVRNLVGKKGFVNEDDTRDLTYLKAVIKETFRLQPVAPLLVPRETLRKCNIGGYDIPAKTLVYVNAWAIGKDPETWENPEEFYPERFIGSPIDYKGQHFELIPFGAGRRVCPGMHMGVAVVELTLSNLLYKFDWEMPISMTKEDIDFDALPGLATHKKKCSYPCG
ncbi:hypothetical protein GOBAR_AA18068 [Gossypium barbadense]|uniref:Cytochrome P450 n=1 Tax=Gossypium barbadense TaxID=3634 RepID=A0A2P5XGW2_GOSBA|nr:hypothetical protein GOBAR_AA18068 [Gossypium barbadense]